MAIDEEDIRERETNAQAGALSSLASSHDWIRAKELLVQKISSLTSILDMDEKLLGDEVELKARKHAANVIGEWIAEIDGSTLLHDKIEATSSERPEILRAG